MLHPGPGSPPMISGGNCTCNDPFLNELATTFLEALPIIANVQKRNLGSTESPLTFSQIGCELIMKSLNLVAEIGAAAIPGVGQAVDAGMSECQPATAP